MNTESMPTEVAVISSPLLAGERVRWTHMHQRGSSIQMTTREGVVIGPSKEKAECWLVKHRGKQIRIHRSQLRRLNENSTLNEIFAAITKPANEKAHLRVGEGKP